MIHALAYVVFILPFTAWLGHELKATYTLRKHWVWIAGAVVAGLIGSYVSALLLPNKTGNFLLHASGGVSSVLLFLYLCKTLSLRFVNWRVTLLMVFAFVSMLGVLNELAEYALESLTGVLYSLDSQDTWRDFVANTLGATIAWATYLLVTKDV
jgi:hypothetical protein